MLGLVIMIRQSSVMVMTYKYYHDGTNSLIEANGGDLYWNWIFGVYLRILELMYSPDLKVVKTALKLLTMVQ